MAHTDVFDYIEGFYDRQRAHSLYSRSGPTAIVETHYQKSSQSVRETEARKHLPKPLTIEPLYDLQIAARLIPYPYPNLKSYLCTHKAQYPARYRHGPRRSRIRILSATEILTLREAVTWYGKKVKHGCDQKK